MPKRTSSPAARHAPQLEIVDPRWVLKALGITIAFALFCAYFTVCIVFFYQQWQLVLQPSRVVAHSPADMGMAFNEVRFANDSSGAPQLDGWWIPADTPSNSTALMLHSANGSMSDALPAAHNLHAAHLNVLLFDYRGYGRSAGKHPTEALMEADSDAGLRYLVDVRHVPTTNIVVYGAGAGGSLAVRLCAWNAQIPALILDSPDGDFEGRVRRDARSNLVPARLLFHENFPLVQPLRNLSTPKLLFTDTNGNAPPGFTQAADPKTTVEFAKHDDDAETQALLRFLDTYVPRLPAALTPNH